MMRIVENEWVARGHNLYFDFDDLFLAALPDPPMDVRVDGGPQDGTILVTWIPVTLNTGLNRHVVPVTGYAVFADGKRVTDVDSPESDHALVDLGCIGHFNPKLITVRSKSGDLLSNDSSAVPIQGGNTQKRRQTRVSFTSRLADKYLLILLMDGLGQIVM